MSELSIEDRSKIDHHVTGCLEKLKKEKRRKLVRKFESLSCNNHKAPNASEITSQLSTDNNLESYPRVTVLTSTSDLPNGTANLLDLGPQFVPSIKTINKRTEFDVNVQLAKLTYRLRWKEIHLEHTTAENEQPTATQNSSTHMYTIEQTIEHSPSTNTAKHQTQNFNI